MPWNTRKHEDPRKDFKGFAEAPKRYEEEVGEAKLNRHRSRDCQNKNTKCHND